MTGGRRDESRRGTQKCVRHESPEGFSFAANGAAAYFQVDGRAFETEAFAELVHQIALVREMQRAGFIRKQDERRRAHAGLGDVEDLALLEVQGLDEAVQPAGGHAMEG